MNTASISELVSAYRDGRTRPRHLLEELWTKIQQSGPAPNWISLFPLKVLLAALERANPDAPLFGVPFAVKDNIDVAGLPTTAACPDFAYTPKESAPVVERLTRAGAIVMGKTNLDQFATGLTGTRSPYGVCSSVFDPRYISGGSSSGSAVVVARGDVVFSLGTDTAGSGRVPAAFNGIYGVKPSRGLLSTRGVVPACRSLDCVSIFCKNLDDARSLLDLCAGYDPLDPFARASPLAGTSVRTPLCIAVPSTNSLEFFGDAESERLFAHSVKQLAALPAEIVPVDLGPFQEAASLLYHGPWLAERLAAIGPFLERHPDNVHPIVRAIIEKARTYSARDAFEAQYRLRSLRRTTGVIWEQIDALLVPSTPTHYTIDQVLENPIEYNQHLGTYTNFVNLLDLCALAIPSGFRSNGLPIGVTLIAPAFRDLSLLEIGQRLGDCFAPQPGAEHRLRANEASQREPPPGRVWLAVAGAHLSGQPLNAELTRRGARLLRTTRTSAEYRLYVLDTQPAKPGLVRTPGNAGTPIQVEIWELDQQAFGSFVREIPAPMTIGSTELEDGTVVKGFSCEPFALEAAEDISNYGGWRAFLDARRQGITEFE